MHFKKFFFTFSLIILSLIAYFSFSVISQPPMEKDLRSQYLKGGDFELTWGSKPFKLSQLQGIPVILYFGYTHCPDVCPVGLALIRDVLNSTDEFEHVPAIFVSLDSERDTADKLKQYVSFFHENIIPLRGTAQEVQKVIEAYGGFFRKVIAEGSNEDEYLVDHSAYYYLIDSTGELVRVFDHTISVDELSESLRALL